ncbi:MAG TPA: hypothetical protein VE861_09615, partial [Gemmatimonadaceae bacterium]|nr:hypothetical protein [Gemmatimonadaceae bacterium]
LVVEGALLARHRRITGRGTPLPQLAWFLGAGAGFTLACRSLAAGWPAWTLAPALSAAFVCHLLHLRASQ